MKRLLLIVAICIMGAWGCAAPEGDGAVGLSGPILESVNSDGSLEFNGAVVNSGDTPVNSIYVVIILKDDKGNTIESNSLSLFEEGSNEVLFPSERAFFSVTVESDPANVFSKEVEIYYENNVN